MHLHWIGKPVTGQAGRRVAWRVTQFARAIRSGHEPAVDAELRQLVGSDARWHLLERLTPFDRAHHLGVYRALQSAGWDDEDLLLAALLHDVGKADEFGRSNAIDRSLRVLLRRIAPGVMRSLVADDRCRLLHGLYLACHHARLGAELARCTGASERCCQLIARHEETTLVDDPVLAALIAADDASIC